MRGASAAVTVPPSFGRLKCKRSSENVPQFSEIQADADLAEDSLAISFLAVEVDIQISKFDSAGPKVRCSPKMVAMQWQNVTRAPHCRTLTLLLAKSACRENAYFSKSGDPCTDGS